MYKYTTEYMMAWMRSESVALALMLLHCELFTAVLLDPPLRSDKLMDLNLVSRFRLKKPPPRYTA